MLGSHSFDVSESNFRKRLVCRRVVTFDEEAALLDALSTLHPKIEGMWAHRRWLYRFALKEFQRSMAQSTAPSDGIVAFHHRSHDCHRFADIYPRNYYAWTYRLDTLVSSLSALSQMSETFSFLKTTAEVELLEQEIECIITWTQTHPNDYSSWHYLLVLWTVFSLLETDLLSPSHPVSSEFSRLDSIHELFPNASSVWIYRSQLLAFLRSRNCTSLNLCLLGAQKCR